MKIAKRVLAIICVCVLVGAGLKVMRWLVIDDTMNFSRLTMHDLYDADENIDILFVGSSHSRRSFVPDVFDENLGVYSFNAGTTSQKVDGAYAVIGEAVQYNDIEHIYLELYYRMAVTDANKDRDTTEMSRVYDISDYMKPSLRKVKFLLQASGKEHYVNSFIVARRKWEKIFDTEYVKSLCEKKTQQSYWNYEAIYNESTGTYYVDRGYSTNDRELGENDIWFEEGYGEIEVDKIPTDWENSLWDIIKLCEKEGIKLSFVVAPLPQATIAGKGNYDEYVNKVRSIADEAGISYYDFNLCKKEYFSCTERAYFADDNHLNIKGSEKLSLLMAELINGQISEKEIFYTSFTEKMEAEEPLLLGLAGPKTNREDGVRYAEIISNRNQGMKYQVVVVPEEGEERVIQDFSENKIFTLPKEEHGRIVIKAIVDGNSDVQILESEY